MHIKRSIQSFREAAMRKQMLSGSAIFLAAFLAACASSAPTAVTGPIVGSPHDLTYVLMPGSPGQASGVILSWTASNDSNIAAFLVNARATVGGAWTTLAITGSNVYFDPNQYTQYFIQAEDASGDIANGPDTITVIYNPTVAAPATVTATGYDSAVKIHWSDEARVNNPGVWSYYRVYSEPASATPPQCPTAGPGFGIEGTTVSEDFVVTGLLNGTTWCYAVTSVGILGQESILSTPWAVATTSQGGGGFDVASAPHATIVVHKTRQGFTVLRGTQVLHR
jgi:hypothetical protein